MVIELHIRGDARFGRVDDPAVGGDEVTKQAPEHARSSLTVPSHEQADGDEGLFANPFAVVAPERRVHPAVCRNHGAELRATDRAEPMKERMIELEVGAFGPAATRILGHVDPWHRDQREPVARAGQRVDERRSASGPWKRRLHQPTAAVRTEPDGRPARRCGRHGHFLRDARRRGVRAEEDLCDVTLRPSPRRLDGRHAISRGPRDAKFAGLRFELAAFGRKANRGRTEAALEVHRECLALPGQTIGIPDQQAERSAFTTRSPLNGRLNKPVPQQEVGDILETRADVEMPARRVVGNVIGRIDHEVARVRVAGGRCRRRHR